MCVTNLREDVFLFLFFKEGCCSIGFGFHGFWADEHACSSISLDRSHLYFSFIGILCRIHTKVFTLNNHLQPTKSVWLWREHVFSYFRNIWLCSGRFWMSIFEQWCVAHSHKQLALCEVGLYKNVVTRLNHGLCLFPLLLVCNGCVKDCRSMCLFDRGRGWVTRSRRPESRTAGLIQNPTPSRRVGPRCGHVYFGFRI